MMRATSRQPPLVALEHREHHPVRDAEARRERLGSGGHQPVERGAVPVHVAALRRLLPDDALELHAIAASLLLHAKVLDDVLGRLRDHEAAVVEALSPRAPPDLLEIAHAEDRRLLAVVLAQAREEHRANRDVHPDAEGVGAADDREQPLLRELLDHQPVLRQEARVVQADAVRQKALHLLAVGRVEAHAGRGERLADGALSLLRQEVDAHQVLRRLGGRALREVDDVHGRAPQPQELEDRLLQGRLAVLELERDGALRRAHRDGRATRELRQRLLERLGRPDGGAHQQELGALEDEQRDLPRDAPLLVGVVVKLVDDDAVDRGLLASPEREVRQDLRGAAHDVRVAVDGRVPGDEADAVGAEVAAEGKELLADEGLDRRRVIAPLALARRIEVQRQRNERFSAPRRRREDDVVAR